MKKIFLSTVYGTAALAALCASPANAASGTWTNNAAGTWSSASNWSSGVIADGAGFTADFSALNITAARTVTIDGAVASRTLGTLLIGDTNGDFSYTIAASGGGTLTFNNGGSGAVLTQVSTSKGDTISVPVVLADNLTVTNNTAVNALTVLGGITSGTAGAKTITTTTGNVTLSGIIGDGSGTVALVQNGAGLLSLAGANTFTGGFTIKSGSVLVSSAGAATSLGAGTVTLGDTSGSADAALYFGRSLTYANAITVQAGSSGNTLTISNANSSSAVASGAITLNNNVTFAEFNNPGGGYSGGGYLQLTGPISGSGNINLQGDGSFVTTNSGTASPGVNITITGAVSTSGTITNSGAGTAIVSIGGVISNASGVIQNSVTSQLVLGGANTFSGATSVKAGVLRYQNANSISANSSITVASGASVQLVSATGGAGQTLTLSGTGSIYSGGALENYGGSSTFSGAIVLNADSVISSSTSGNTFTIATGGITGSGKNLNFVGPGNTTISAVVGTGAGAVTKNGTGTLSLSGSNTYTGLTTINRGNLQVASANALGGGGNITFGGGALQYTASNSVDFSSRIVNSQGSIAIDTNGQSRTFASGLASSNVGGFTKIGSGTLTLSGTNSYSGITAINGGLLAISTAAALPSTSTIFIDATGGLNSGGAYANVQAWLNSGKIDSTSIGAIALTGASSENIDFTGYNNLMLGASAASIYTGTITPAGGNYRLGGGAAAITVANTNALTGSGTLTVGARTGNGSSAGGLTLSGANNLTGATTVAASTLTLNSATAGLATSDVTVNSGAALAFNYAAGNLAADNNVTRAKSVQLNGSTFNISGNTGGNSTETITGALTAGSGNSTIAISPATGKHSLLAAGSFVRNSGGTILFRGTSLGTTANSATNVSTANVSFGTGPTLNGTGSAGGSGTTIGIITGAYGDTNASLGSGFGATGGLVTYDATNGVRLLNTATEYTTAITNAQTALDNVRYANTTASLITTTLSSNTTINSLSFVNSGTGGVTVAGSGTLKLNSGVIYSSQTAADAVLISGVALDFNGQEAIVLNQNTGTFTIDSVISNATGLTKAGSGMLILSGASANTYTGTTTVNGGNLRLAKTAGVNAISGDLVINGATVSMSASNQIADTANVTVNGGTFLLSPSGSNNGAVSETINNLTMTNAATISYGQAPSGAVFTINGNANISGGVNLFQAIGGQLVIGGALNLSDFGSLQVRRSQTTTGGYDSIANLNGGLNITNTATGAYTAIVIESATSSAQTGGQVALNSDLTFTGNSTNTNTTMIDALAGAGTKGVIALSGSRNFNIGDGAAKNDLTINATIQDGGSVGGFTKTGAGTLVLSEVNTYTGATVVSAGTLLVNGTINNTSGVTVNGGIFNYANNNTALNRNVTVAGGNFKYNSSQAYAGSLTFTSGTVSGSGNLSTVSFTIGSGSTLSPGNSPGTLTTGAETWANGGTYLWEINALSLAQGGAGSAGTQGSDPGWDFANIAGGLTITAGVGQFNLNVDSLLALTNWNSSGNYQWTIATASGGVTGFNSNVFNIDTSAFSDQNSIAGGAFSVSNIGNDIILSYTAVPEPSTYALLGLGLGSLWFLRRRQIRNSKQA